MYPKLVSIFGWALIVLLGGCTSNNQPATLETETVDSTVSKATKKLESGLFKEAQLILETVDSSQLNEISLAIYNNGFGCCYFQKTDYPKALSYFAFANEGFKHLKMKDKEVSCAINMASCFKAMGLFDKAVAYAKIAENFFIQTNEHAQELEPLFNLIGNIFTETGSYTLALEYHRKSHGIRLINGSSIAPSLNNIGNVHYELKNYDSALLYFNNYKTLAITEGKVRKEGRAHENLAKTYTKTEQDKLATSHLDTARKLYKQDQYISGLASANLIEARLLKHNNPEAALRLIEEAQNMNTGTSGLELEMLEELETIANILDMKELAYKTTKRHQELKDSIKGQKVISKIFADEMFSRLETKNREILQISQQKEQEATGRRMNAFQRNGSILLAIIFALFGLLWFKRYKQKQKFVDEYFSTDAHLVLKSGKSLEFDDIMRIETYRNDLIFHTVAGKISEKRCTLKELLESAILPKIQFSQIQHGIVVNFNHVTKMLKTKITMEHYEVKLSPKFKEEVLLNWEIYQSAKSQAPL